MRSNNEVAKTPSNSRVFPRMDTECPVLYAIGSSERWRIGKLVNMSATGLRMTCEEPLLRNISITIKTEPGSNRLVPGITGKGKITRCETLDKANRQYQISCKLSKVSSNPK
ncbi:MAG: hypothetical protein ACC707_02670 [Thiohalomonadales bacterium]